MNKNKFIILIFALSTLIVSCADQGNKLKVSGAQVESDITENKNKVSEDGSEVIISDQLNNDKNLTVDQVLLEELIEVGDRVYFDYDKSKFKNQGVETLKRQARFLNENPDITITVEGHCDPRGTREYNLALGERRAYSVKNFLVSLGVSNSRISVLSYGKEKPQVDGNDENAWAQSRTAVTVINP